MANSDAKMQSTSIYYNIDIYNDNSTNGDISSKFQTAFNSPLLMDTSNYEVAVARARVPLDQIPLSQENIPFQKWQIEIGVPSVANPPTYTYYNSYVPQFNPYMRPINFNTTTVGINGNPLDLLTINSINSPIDPVLSSLTTMPSQTPIISGFTLHQGIAPTSELSSFSVATSGYNPVYTTTLLQPMTGSMNTGSSEEDITGISSGFLYGDLTTDFIYGNGFYYGTDGGNGGVPSRLYTYTMGQLSPNPTNIVFVAEVMQFDSAIIRAMATYTDNVVFLVLNVLQNFASTNQLMLYNVNTNTYIVIPLTEQQLFQAFTLTGMSVNDVEINFTILFTGGDNSTTSFVYNRTDLSLLSNYNMNIGMTVYTFYHSIANTVFSNSDADNPATQFNILDYTTYEVQGSFNLLSGYKLLGFLGNDQFNNLLVSVQNLTNNLFGIMAFNKTTEQVVYYFTNSNTQVIAISQFTNVAGPPEPPPFIPTNVSNVVFTQNYIAVLTSLFEVTRYTYAGVFYDITNIRTELNDNSITLHALCSSQIRDNIYVLGYSPTRTPYNWFLCNLFGADTVDLIKDDGSNFDVNIDIFSMSCSATKLSVTLQNGLDISVTNPFVFDIGGNTGAFTRLNPLQANLIELSAHYIDNNDRYYEIVYNTSNPIARQTDIPTATAFLMTFNIPNYQTVFAQRILGSDTWDNLLIVLLDTVANTSSIVAYNKITGGDPVYTIQMSTSTVIIMSDFITTAQPPVVSPSLTPNYQVMTINEYLRQINLAFESIFSQIPTPLSSPVLAPRLVFDSTTSLVSIVCDPGCASSFSTACVINFNQLLWSLFKFNSIQAVNTALTAIGGAVRTLEIDDAIAPASSITPQPNSTMYRFSDLTRIIIGTSRMGVYGDNQNNDKLLVNIGDFTVDTENGIPNLIIYNPVILRFYKLYQQVPLTNIDVFISYANRAGDVFPISISPYNSIGLKLEFQRIPLV